VLFRSSNGKCLSGLVFPWSDSDVMKRTRPNTTAILRARTR
jgi:hypothetical protein